MPGQSPYFIGTVLATILVSILLCRQRIAHKKHLFLATALASAVIANVATFVVIFLSERMHKQGWRIFASETWRWRAGRLDGLEAAMFTAWLFTTVGTLICILPALGIACYYERRSKNDVKGPLQTIDARPPPKPPQNPA